MEPKELYLNDVRVVLSPTISYESLLMAPRGSRSKGAQGVSLAASGSISGMSYESPGTEGVVLLERS